MIVYSSQMKLAALAIGNQSIQLTEDESHESQLQAKVVKIWKHFYQPFYVHNVAHW